MRVVAGAIALRVQGLRKRYRALDAVRGIGFEVGEGEIFGLIGPDGAGKTSTFQILAGVMEPTDGVAEVFGRPAREARSQTGYLTQTFSLYPDLTVWENLRYAGDLRRVPPRDVAERGLRYLRMFDLDRFVGRLAGRLSGGMKQKLSLACALVAAPRVLLLDEPTTGVDPVSRREFWDALAHLAADGLTILMATPYLDEAERCHRVALIHRGEFRQSGTPAEIRGGLGVKRLAVYVDGLSAAERLLAHSTGPMLDVQRFGDRLDVLARRPEEARDAVERTLREGGLRVADVRVDEPSLENVFVASLRALGEEPAPTTFPGRRDHGDLRGGIAIGAERLTKRFGSFTAVNDVNLSIRHGEVYGLLGANGAGKTTTIKMLCGLLDPTAGEIRLAGEDADLRGEGVRQRIGYMSQKFSLYDDLTIGENLEFFAGVYGVPPDERAEKIRWVLAFSGLEGKADLVTRSLPGGWKQRVAFGAAIMHEPSVLFLDEPTSGVDPLARRAFWRMINGLADAGAAILVTTHYLEESEHCNRLGFMVAGALVAEGTPDGLKRRQGGHLLEFVVDRPQRAADLLKAQGERWRVALFGARLHLITDDDAISAREATRRLLEANDVRVIEAREAPFSLEDVFISVVEGARGDRRVAAPA
jgi:ABC-2 type transport system ATP-binding protein